MEEGKQQVQTGWQRGGGRRRGCRATGLQGNPREAKTPSGIDSSGGKNSSRDNPGSDSPGALASINPGRLERLSVRKWRAQVTGTNASPLGYGFGRGPAGRELAEPAAVGWAGRNKAGGSRASPWQPGCPGTPRAATGKGSLWVRALPSNPGTGRQKEGGEAGLCFQLFCGHGTRASFAQWPLRASSPLLGSLGCCRKEETQGKLWMRVFGEGFCWMGWWCQSLAQGCPGHWDWDGAQYK